MPKSLPIEKAMQSSPSRPSLLDALAHSAVQRALAALLPCVQAGTLPAPCLLIDATAGNGHDTCFLASLAQSCALPQAVQVHAFDVQQAALAATTARLHSRGLQQGVCLHHASHEQAQALLPPALPIAAAMFNLGYLPSGDKTIITKANSSVAALATLLPRLAEQGVISLHYYTGHAGGAAEAEALLAYAAALPPKLWRVLQSHDANREHAGEGLLLLEKLPRKRQRPPAA
jgi:hypothetical protein